MFSNTAAEDPWIYYKMMHVDRVKAALAVSYDLGLYRLLEDAPRSVVEIAGILRLQLRPATILLCANACVGILGVKQGRYYLRQSYVDFVSDQGLAINFAKQLLYTSEENFLSYKQSFLTNSPDPKCVPAWIEDPEGTHGTEAFDVRRDGFRMMWGMALANAFDFSPYNVVADLGGATGGMLSGLTQQCPHLKGLLVELPYSKQKAEACIADAGASNNVEFYSADFLKDPLPNADVMFMSHVLHDWNDENCISILRRCHDALPSGHPVIAQEFLLNDQKTGSYIAVFQWVGLLRWTMGDQRTAAEISSLMEQAGFSTTETRPVDQEQSIVIGWKK